MSCARVVSRNLRYTKKNEDINVGPVMRTNPTRERKSVRFGMGRQSGTGVRRTIGFEGD